MGYDKVVDSAALDGALTGIANAIRGKTGGTAALTLEQMPGAISGIETEPVLQELAVTENGEYIPGEGVDGFGRVTVEVEGEGLPDGIYAVATGTFTVASQTAMTIEHNLGVIPRVFVVFAENQWFYSVDGNTLILYGAVRFNLANDASFKNAWGTRTNVGVLASNHYVDLTETTARIGPNSSTHGWFQPTQNTTADGDPEQLVYRWYAIA